jgi:hypothetical protein
METATTSTSTTSILSTISTWIDSGVIAFCNLILQRETWIAIGILAISLIILWSLSNFRESRKHSLTTKIKEELKKSCKSEGPSVLFREWFEQIYLPSWQSVVTVLFFGAVLFLLAHVEKFRPFFSSLPFQNSDHYQNLIAIHAGIGTIIFALLIFVAESLRDDETKDRARVLLRESFLFPLSVAEIVGFFIFVWGDVNVWATVPLIVVAILTIASLWRLLLVLLSKARFSKKRLQLLKDRVRKSINLAIVERFGNTILLNSLGEGKTELKYYPFSLDDENSTHHVFYADRIGVVTNIRLDKLDKFAKLVEKNANEKGFSFYEDKVKPVSKEATSGAGISEGEVTKLVHADHQYLSKKFKDTVDEDSQVLLAVDKRCVTDQTVIKELSTLAREIFTIKKEDNFSEEIKLEINGLTDQFIAAIEAKKIGKIEELAKTYFGLADSFLEAINACGGGYNYEQARKERGAFFGGWNEVRWLSDSIREILVKATQTHDREIIREVAYMPVHIATKAIKLGDQYVYQEFLTFPPFLYWLSNKEQQEDVKELMIDRSWRHLKEMSDYYIEHELKRKARDVQTIEKYKEYTIPIFTAFQNLLKAAFDKRQIDDFSEFIGKFSSLYGDLEEDFRFPRAEHLRFDLERTSDSRSKVELEKKIEIQEARESAAKDIKERKNQVIFGITAWIFEQYRKNKDDGLLQRFYSESSQRLPNTLPELTSLFISARTFETEHFWDWDNWETIPDGEVHIIDVNSKQDRLYCVKALQILGPMTDDLANQIVLPTSRDFAFLVEDRPGGHTIIPILNEIEANSAAWSFVLDTVAISKVVILKSLLQKAKDEQEKKEDQYLQSVEVSPLKLEEFKTKIKEAFYSTVRLRPIADRLGIYKNLLNETPGKTVPSWGYNQLDNKAAFIENWHVHYGGWGDTYGDGIANSEDQLIFEQLVEAVEIKKDVKKDDIINEIGMVIAEQKMENPIIIQTLEYLFEYDSIKRSDLFIEKYRRDCPKTPFSDLKSFLGVFKLSDRNIPVIDIFVRDKKLENKIIVTDLERLGTFNQYAPIDKPEDSVNRYDIFFLRVDDLNKDTEQRNKILVQNPDWLQQYSDKEGHLKSCVVVRLYEKFKFEIKDPKAGACLTVVKV